MKKAVLSLFLLVLSISLVSALDITITKSSYFQGETLQGEITDTFVGTLKDSNIKIYKGNTVHESGAVKGVIKVEKKYYFYVILPESTGDYSLRIEGIKHYEGTIQSESIIEKNFSITSTTSPYLAVSPGALYATGQFKVTVKAFNDYQDVSVEFPPSGFKHDFNIGYTEEKILFIPLTGITSPIVADLTVNSFAIKVVANPLSNQTTQNVSNETVPEVVGGLDELIALDVREINASILPNISYRFEVTIVNKNQSVKNLEFSSPSSRISVSPSKIDILSHEETITLTINSESNIDSSLKIKHDNNTLSIPVLIEIVDNLNYTHYNVPNSDSQKTCSQLGGIQCIPENNEACTGSRVLAVDGECCLADCSAPKKSSTGWIIGIFLLIALAIVAVFLYVKYKKGEPPEFLEKLLKRKTEKYQERFSVKPPVEVRKGLTKV